MLERNQARTKIVATLGPACANVTRIRELVRASVDGFRINLSHGDVESRTALVKLVHKVRKESNRPLAVIADLCGPRLRLGRLSEPICLSRGDIVQLRTGKTSSRDGSIPVDYRGLLRDVEIGHRVLIRDGRVEMEVIAKDGRRLTCKVRKADIISSRQGINLPDSDVSAPVISAKDYRDLQWAADLGIDWVAMSFVRSSSCLTKLRNAMAKVGLQAPIIAKLEHPEAVKNLNQILANTNAVMVARGDLAVEMGHEIVPLVQKRIIRAARDHGVPVITATQMLESMITSSTPTRAEVSDIANAVIDGSDAVMLSGETAVGIDPTGTARVMARIIIKTERELYGRPVEQRMALTRRGYNRGVIEAAAVSAAISAANQAGAKAILAFTESGRVARLLSSFRTGIPVIGLTAEERSFHRMAIYWGVRPALVRSFRSSKGMLHNAHKILQEVSWLKPDDLLVLLTGAFAKSGATNTIRLIRASSLAPSNKFP